MKNPLPTQDDLGAKKGHKEPDRLRALPGVEKASRSLAAHEIVQRCMKHRPPIGGQQALRTVSIRELADRSRCRTQHFESTSATLLEHELLQRAHHLLV